MNEVFRKNGSHGIALIALNGDDGFIIVDVHYPCHAG